MGLTLAARDAPTFSHLVSWAGLGKGGDSHALPHSTRALKARRQYLLGRLRLFPRAYLRCLCVDQSDAATAFRMRAVCHCGLSRDCSRALWVVISFSRVRLYFSFKFTVPDFSREVAYS